MEDKDNDQALKLNYDRSYIRSILLGDSNIKNHYDAISQANELYFETLQTMIDRKVALHFSSATKSRILAAALAFEGHKHTIPGTSPDYIAAKNQAQGVNIKKRKKVTPEEKERKKHAKKIVTEKKKIEQQQLRVTQKQKTKQQQQLDKQIRLLQKQAERLERQTAAEKRKAAESKVSAKPNVQVIDKNSLVGFLLKDDSFIGVAEVLRAVQLLDVNRKIRYLTKKLNRLEIRKAASEQSVKAKTLTDLKTTIHNLSQEILPGAAMNGSKAKKIRKWVQTIAPETLEFFLLNFPTDVWRNLADICHIKKTDFSVPYFLPVVFGEKAPAQSLYLVAQAVTPQTLAAVITKYPRLALCYSYIRKRLRDHAQGDILEKEKKEEQEQKKAEKLKKAEEKKKGHEVRLRIKQRKLLKEEKKQKKSCCCCCCYCYCYCC